MWLQVIRERKIEFNQRNKEQQTGSLKQEDEEFLLSTHLDYLLTAAEF